MDIKDEKIFEGYWFLPSQPENKIAGILKVNGFKSFNLDLIGGFTTEIKQLLGNIEQDEVIYGIVYNEDNHLRDVTLFDCSPSLKMNLSSEHPLVKYKCQYFIDGIHLDSKKTKSFYKVCADFSNLYDWKPAKLINHSIIYSKEKELSNTPEKIIIEAKVKDNWELPVEIEDGYRIILYSSINYNPPPNYETVNMNQNTLFRIESDSDQSIFNLIIKLNLFKQFISLGTLSDISYRKIRLYDKQNYQELEKGNKLENPIYLYYRYWGNEIDTKNTRHNNSIFSYSDIENEYADLIKKWFKTDPNFIPIREHLIESISYKKLFTSKDFLVLIQAIEGYHTRFVNEGKCDLKNRLSNLVEDKFSDIQIINKITPVDIEIIKDSRHYYSHLFISKTKIADGLELFELSIKLRNLLICCVLSLIGFDNQKINELLTKNLK